MRDVRAGPRTATHRKRETAGQTLRAACGVKRFREMLPVSVYARPASERYLVLNISQRLVPGS